MVPRSAPCTSSCRAGSRSASRSRRSSRAPSTSCRPSRATASTRRTRRSSARRRRSSPLGPSWYRRPRERQSRPSDGGRPPKPPGPAGEPERAKTAAAPRPGSARSRGGTTSCAAGAAEAGRSPGLSPSLPTSSTARRTSTAASTPRTTPRARSPAKLPAQAAPLRAARRAGARGDAAPRARVRDRRVPRGGEAGRGRAGDRPRGLRVLPRVARGRGHEVLPPGDAAADRAVTALRPNLLVAWDVWEHLCAPASTLDALLREADPGVTVAITTVDAGSPVARIRGTRWRQFHPPTHLCYPTRRSLRLYLERPRLRDRVPPIVRLYRPLARVPARRRRARLRVASRVADDTVFLDLYDVQIVIARRTAS